MILRHGSQGDDVRTLQTQLRAFGFYQGAIDGDFGPKTDAGVRSFQTARGLAADGIVGASTWTAVLKSPLSASSAAELDAKLAAAGRRAVEEARRYLALDIIDPAPGDTSANGVRCRTLIDEMLLRCRLPHRVPYAGNGKGPQWCGIFDAACWEAAGIDPAVLPIFWPSTWRLRAWAHYEPFDAEHPNRRPSSGPYRLVAHLEAIGNAELPFEPREGDIMIVGDGNPEEGDHVTLVVSYDDTTRTFTVISGNTVVRTPAGKRREGVAQATYKIGSHGYRPMWLYRPAPRDVL